MTVLYGISNCDTIRKAKKWLSENNVAFEFHDFRKDGLSETWLLEAEKQIGWQVLLNKRGTTFRQLSEEQKSDLDKAKAIALMLQYPAMIKRPILEHKHSYLCGFSAQSYEQALS